LDSQGNTLKKDADMRKRVSTGYVIGMVYLACVVLLISMAGMAHANEGDVNQNTFYGTGTGASLDGTGIDNAFFGYDAGNHTTSGSGNTFIGRYAGLGNITGSSNTFLGINAGASNDNGNYNTYMGQSAGQSNQSGDSNTFIGYAAGYLTTGQGNVFVGYRAGYNETGSNKLYIANSNTTTPLIKGNFSAGTLTIYGTLTTASDERLKKNIMPLDAALKQIMSLQGVSYEWKEGFIGGGLKRDRQIGLVAQEVETVMPELVHTDSNGYKAIAYDKLAPVLIEAVKEQNVIIKRQQKVLDEQQTINKALAEQMTLLRAQMSKLERKELTVLGTSSL
jgi:hypothetical protein